ncbi:MAG: hypothetical protein IPM90_12245 [Austwickia sp.]|nr:hypothetical protein [Austwickia sp.]MBK9102243.1 hypothetical protein [Austwickia sp.]
MTPTPVDDHDAAARQSSARTHLMAIGGHELPRFPWMTGDVPHADVTLIRYTLWRASNGQGVQLPEDLYAALRLMESARAELDAMEARLLFTARAEGLTWPQIAEHLGVRTPQAAQQRFERVTARTDAERER